LGYECFVRRGEPFQIAVALLFCPTYDPIDLAHNTKN
jgi:hypothetical protein